MTDRKRILSVDDDPDICHAFRLALVAEGDDVTTVERGPAGLEILEQEQVDLVILDIRMPEMDGLTFLAQARELNRSLPIILSSAYASYKEDFRTWGADAFVVKGSELEVLRETVRRRIGKGEPAAE